MLKCNTYKRRIKGYGAMSENFSNDVLTTADYKKNNRFRDKNPNRSPTAELFLKFNANFYLDYFSTLHPSQKFVISKEPL